MIVWVLLEIKYIFVIYGQNNDFSLVEKEGVTYDYFFPFIQAVVAM